MTTTYVHEILPSGRKRLIHTITFSSRFKTLPWVDQTDMCDKKNQLRAARELADGWKLRGPEPQATYEITQV